MSSHAGMVATIVAREPSDIDFSCGFQPFFPSGTLKRLADSDSLAIKFRQ